MLSQLTLRFPKKLIEALKARAGEEDTSVNALAERLIGGALKAPVPDEEWFSLISDPAAAAERLYRKIAFGEDGGAAGLSRAELRYLCMEVHEGYMVAETKELVSRAPLRALLDVTGELLAWQEVSGAPVDGPYLKGTFGLSGESWSQEYAAFRAALPVAVTAGRAERLLRPLTAGSFDLTAVPEDVLASIFTPERLRDALPLVMRSRDWEPEQRRDFSDAVRPRVAAANAELACGPVSLTVRVSGHDPAVPADVWYEAPDLHLLVTGRDFVMPFGWMEFAELLRTLAAYRADPAALPRGHHGRLVVLSPPGLTGNDGFIGLGALRVFLSPEDFTALTEAVCVLGEEGTLADPLGALRCLFGDL